MQCLRTVHAVCKKLDLHTINRHLKDNLSKTAAITYFLGAPPFPLYSSLCCVVKDRSDSTQMSSYQNSTQALGI